MTAQDVVDHMLRYRTYIQGITVSGGEALLQPHFVAALFEAAHQHGLNTCLDTAGQSPKQNWELVLPHTDLALVCIKHTDPAKYQTFTGLKQKVSREFVEALAFQHGVPFYLRYLYIPGFSDDDEEIERFLAYAARFRPLLRGIELLPYHRLGVEKWRAQGLAYALEGVPVPDREEVQRVKQRMEDRGFEVLFSLSLSLSLDRKSVV